MKIKLIIQLVILLFINQVARGDQPQRVILVTIDGLHWKAPSKLNLTHFNSLLKEGTYIKKSYMITPHHPSTGDYGKYNSSSFPNPVLHQGTLFINNENKQIQQLFYPDTTAFVVNAKAYRTVSRDFTISIQKSKLSDKDVITKSIELLKAHDIRFMRIHLQSPGNAGQLISRTSSNQPYFRNIWGKGSPYVDAINNADKLLGDLVNYLKASGKYENTLLIVSSDNGQSEIGWHMMRDPDSWRVPLVFVGPGIKMGKELEYFEHTDITPTICDIMNIEKPNTDGGAGKSRKDLLTTSKNAANYPQHIKQLNTQINDYIRLNAKIALAADENVFMSSMLSWMENRNHNSEPFYHHNSIMEWSKAGNIEHLLENNDRMLIIMGKILETEEYIKMK